MSRKLNDSLVLKTHIVDNSWHTLLHFKHRLRTHGPRLVMFHFPHRGAQGRGERTALSWKHSMNMLSKSASLINDAPKMATIQLCCNSVL